MSTGSSTQPATYPETPARQRRGFPRLRDARIRSKLALILFVPLLAVLALATVRLIDVGSRAIDATQVEDLTRLSTDVSELTQVMHKERMAAARYLATPDGQLDVAPPAPAPWRRNRGTPRRSRRPTPGSRSTPRTAASSTSRRPR